MNTTILCQFLLGTVQPFRKMEENICIAMNVSIPLRYGTTISKPEDAICKK